MPRRWILGGSKARQLTLMQDHGHQSRFFRQQSHQQWTDCKDLNFAIFLARAQLLGSTIEKAKGPAFSKPRKAAISLWTPFFIYKRAAEASRICRASFFVSSLAIHRVPK